MKIAIIGPVYPYRGGIAHFSGCLFRELEKDKHQALLVNFRKQYPTFLFPGKRQTESESYFQDIPSLRILIPYNPFTYRKTLKKLLEFNPDLVVFQFFLPFFIPAYCYLLKRIKRRKIKTLIIAHNINFHERWLFAKTLTRKLLKKTDRIMTLSDTVYKEAGKLLQNNNDKLIRGFHPLYTFHNQNVYSRESARKRLGLEEQKVILFFGYIKPYKGVDLLIRSFILLKKELKEAILLIAGEVYGNKDKYLNLIKESGYTEDIILWDEYIGSADVELYFKAADLLVLPYRTATQSGVIQTAYVMGLGVVTTPVGGLPEMVMPGKTGVVANSVSAEDLASAISSYFTLDVKMVRESISQFCNRYSWNNFVQLMSEAL